MTDADVGQKSHTRLSWIDVIKGIGILLTIFYHCLGGGTLGRFLPKLQTVIASFHMPLFFFVSGYLYRKKPAKDFFFSKMTALVIPYVLVQFINWFLQLGVSGFCRVTGAGSFYHLLRLEGYWFILSLLYVCLIYYILDCALSKRIKSTGPVILAIAAAFFVLCMVYCKFAGVKSSIVLNACSGFLYYSFGAVCKRGLQQIRTGGAAWIVGAAASAAVYFSAQANTLVTMAQNEYGNPFLFLISSLCGIVAVSCIGIGIGKNNILEFFGKNSLVTITTQFPVFRVIKTVLQAVFHSEPLIVIFCFLLTCLVEYCLIKAINAYFPMFAGKFRYNPN